ncbi:hypothetical protein PPERSA_02883 [Pseudocohnilembus persalinus]|uniref:Insertion element IS150 protein InsJ-like helix-turn-helix domain-containing protein n=1 Tax=Pseudocohnilembus persalinus TaxID=266149 RepID=A0A0V0QNG7_PSEPJ|nr:hypothetical protein PPERSA_02883 [Pseudocohnilembus persalinus]|eukprot:KRX03504.1 hypothetical protein PPERSA_02883 [Pseudocohnilembus persalinus]
MPGQQYYHSPQPQFMNFDQYQNNMNNNNNNMNNMNNNGNKGIIKKEEDDQDMNEDNNIEAENDSDSQSKDENGKKKYSVISIEVRQKFIDRVLSKEVTIKEAAKEFGIKFSTSKAILQTYKKEGRIGKKKTRIRKPRAFRAGDGDSQKAIPAALQVQNNLVKKEHSYLNPPQLDQESVSKMNDIQNMITQPQSGSSLNQQNNSPYFINNANNQNNNSNLNNSNNYNNTSGSNNNNNNNMNQGFGNGLIMNKLKSFNNNSNGRNLSINTGNGIVQMAVQNLNQNKSLNSLNIGLNDKTTESTFFNPFSTDEEGEKFQKQNNFGKNNRESVIDIKNLKSQLTQLSVDKIKSSTCNQNNLGSQTTTNDDEDNSGQFVINQEFNYNNYFSYD